MIIDHILRFADEASAHAALDPLGLGTSPNWDASRVIPGLQILLPDASVYEADHFWLGIGLPGLLPALVALPGNALRAAMDRGKAALDLPFYVYIAPDVDTAILSTARVSPVFAGSDY
jgi:hypothetical protein